MTSYQLAYRMLRHCDPQDLAALSEAHRYEVAGAISRALAFFFTFAPDILRRSTASIELDAPRTISNMSMVSGSPDISTGSPFTDEERGASILIDGDRNRNEVVARAGLLNPYLGDTGTRNGTLYYDCVPVHSRLINAITSDPWILLGNGGTRNLCSAMNGSQNPNTYDWGQAYYDEYWRSDIDVGSPTHWGIQHSGASQASDVYFLLRVHPAPTEKMVIRFEVDLSPDMIDAQNIVNTPIDLPLSDTQIESMLLPIAEREMLQTTLWSNKEVMPLIMETARRAEAQMERLRPNFANPKVRRGTPQGW